MVVISDEKSIFLTDFDKQTNELSFRMTFDPRQVHKETIAVVGPNIKTNLYFFHRSFLEKFVNENQN